MANKKEVRLFNNDLLESLTHVHPAVPAIIWLPFIGLLIYKEIQVGHQLSTWLTGAALGLIVWTLTEYILHRFVFHFSATSKAGKWLVYAFHGLHHDDPQNPTRLVMPPVPAIIYSSLLYGFYYLIVGPELINIFFSFFMLGYLAYDYIHFYTHHGKGEGRMGKFLKRYHLDHHFKDHDKKYGVSSPLWDHIFRTR